MNEPTISGLLRGGGKAGEGGGGWGGDKSKALLKLGRCAAGLKITPCQQTMSGQNHRYSQTSRYGHLYNTDTSVIRTVRLVPEMPKISYTAYLYNTDTSVKWTLGSVPLVSVLIRIDCIRIIHFYCFPFITTITSTFLLFSLHHHHRYHHISIVSLHSRHHHHISIVFPTPSPPYSQTSLIRTSKGQNQVSTLQKCPYYRGRQCMIPYLVFLRPNELSVIERCPYREV